MRLTVFSLINTGNMPVRKNLEVRCILMLFSYFNPQITFIYYIIMNQFIQMHVNNEDISKTLILYSRRIMNATRDEDQ